MVSMAAHHAEWLSLIEVSGPFLSVPVLKDALPNGLDAHDPHVAAETRAALEQWSDPDLGDPGAERAVDAHLAFAQFVLQEVLGFDDDVMRWGGDQALDWAGVASGCVVDGDNQLMPVAVFWPDTPVDEILSELGSFSPQQRMVEHLKETGLRVGLVTDGERWALVSYQEGENPGFATWWASLWGEEKITLQAFRTLLHQDRFLTLGEDESIGALLDRSAEDQREVTTKLGNQTLDAVEILIRTIDRIDQERGGELLREVEAEKGIAELYDAAVTVMMRLIFLFYAEENDLLPMSEPLYVERYAASSLRERLQAAADEHGEEVLESTHDGWPRLLSTWRAVYGGVEHGDMVLAPYGGSLFDPDRYPFLEGRQPSSSWLVDAADPLPIDNRTVLHLLNALQTLEEGGQRRKLSFRALDVEQIGHVYEGMLDHTASRAEGWVLGLSGTGGREPEVELTDLDGLVDEKALLDYLKDETGRGAATTKRWIADTESERAVANFGTSWPATFVSKDVEHRARRFAKLIRPDSTGAPTAFQPGSVFVADSSHRGATGTHYTPRSLTEESVKHTLDPLVYVGPADGRPEEEWEIRTPEELLELNICDPACGSGAFLVQVCRYLADHLVEAERHHGRRSDAVTESEVLAARRTVAEHCLHGVDLNPMACEMAKLSLWLVTLARDLPFSFVDHAIRLGDSLLGIESLDQLRHLHLEPRRGAQMHEGTLFDVSAEMSDRLDSAYAAIEAIAATPTLEADDVAQKQAALERADAALGWLVERADVIVAARLATPDAKDYDALIGDLASSLAEQRPLSDAERSRCESMLERGNPSSVHRRPFHWPLEFPLVFRDGGRFDAFIANPPFLGGTKISGPMGSDYRQYIASTLAGESTDRADLVAFFFMRAVALSRSLGFISTNSVSQGDTREFSLEKPLSRGWRIHRAVKSAEWPGVANLEISKVWMTNSDWGHRCVLDGLVVSAIDSELTEPSRVRGLPRRLAAYRSASFQGSKLDGIGFTLDFDEANALLAQDQRNAEVIQPYVVAKDVNQRPDCSASRMVINFRDWPLDRAAVYEGPMSVVEQRVRPDRESNKREHHRRYWWHYGDKRPELYESIKDNDRVLVIAGVSKAVLPAWLQRDMVYAHALFVFTYDDDASFGLLTSAFHWWWAVTYASTLETRIRYTPTDCFDTFPQPAALTDAVGATAAELHSFRSELMLAADIGLTSLYNRVSDPDEEDQGVLRLRQLHQDLDVAVAASYDWTDLELGHGFHETPQGLRFTVSPEAARELLDRLLELNFERFIDEVAQGLHPDASGSEIRRENGVVTLVVP